MPDCAERVLANELRAIISMNGVPRDEAIARVILAVDRYATAREAERALDDPQVKPSTTSPSCMATREHQSEPALLGDLPT